MPPPPLTPLPKFWSLFLPISERVHDTEQLVFSADGEGTRHQTEFVVEVVVREGNGRHRGVERVLEGWSTIQGGPCELSGLESLNHLLKKQKVVREAILRLFHISKHFFNRLPFFFPARSYARSNTEPIVQS